MNKFEMNPRYAKDDGISNFIKDIDSLSPIEIDFYLALSFINSMVAGGNSNISAAANEDGNIYLVDRLASRLARCKSLLEKLKGRESGEKVLVKDY
jgi:hypothetical protein